MKARKDIPEMVGGGMSIKERAGMQALLWGRQGGQQHPQGPPAKRSPWAWSTGQGGDSRDAPSEP